MMRVLQLSVCTVAAAALFACSEKKAPAPPPKKPEPAKPTPAAEPPAEEGTPAEAPAAEGGPVGKLSGTVSFEGKAPEDTDIDMKSDKKCMEIATLKKTTDYKIKDNKVGDVFVYVSEGLPPDKKYDPPKDPVVLDQQGCRYHPRVFGIMAKQPLEIVNSDPLLHNIHAMGKQEFNVGMPTQGQKIKKTFKRPEQMVAVKCDVHSWMHASIGVMDHPFFAVTDEAGSYTIPDLPPGKYTVVAWHSKLGEQKSEVEVPAGGAATLDFKLTAK